MKKKLLMTASVWVHIANFHLPYLLEFQNRGWETHAACSGIPVNAPFISRAIDLPFEKKFTSAANFRVMRMIRQLAEHEKYDLIIAHTTLASFFTRLALNGMKNRPPLVNVMHGYLFDENTPFPKKQILLAAEKFTAPETDLLLTMNRWDQACAEKYRLGKRIARIPGMGVDFSRLAISKDEDGRALRSALGIPADDFVLIYAAEFSKRKNQRFLIEALKNLPKNVWLVLCGEGELMRSCRMLAEDLGVLDRVIFPGHVQRIGEWYRMADAAVSSSRSEGLPFNIMEAMYMGLPVIASRVKGHTDLIRDGENGFLFPSGDSKTYLKCVVRIMVDSTLQKRMSNKNHDLANYYNLTLVKNKVMEEYLSI